MSPDQATAADDVALGELAGIVVAGELSGPGPSSTASLIRFIALVEGRRR